MSIVFFVNKFSNKRTKQQSITLEKKNLEIKKNLNVTF